MQIRKVAGVLILSLASITVASAFEPNRLIPVHGAPPHDGGGNGGGAAAAPEIDPAGAFSALTLLAGGLAVLRGRRGPRGKNDRKDDTK